MTPPRPHAEVASLDDASHVRPDRTREDPIKSNALGTLVLWPSASAEVVGTNPPDDAEPPRALLDLLKMPRSPIDTIANSRCGWSVGDPDQAMLRLAVRVVQLREVALGQVVCTGPQGLTGRERSPGVRHGARGWLPRP